MRSGARRRRTHARRSRGRTRAACPLPGNTGGATHGTPHRQRSIDRQAGGAAARAPGTLSDRLAASCVQATPHREDALKRHHTHAKQHTRVSRRRAGSTPPQYSR
eukprot:4286310-Prymnesium_polylepis.1